MKVAVITGASSGMGREMALAIDSLIPNVEELWLFGRRRHRLREMELGQDFWKKAKAFPWDLRKPASMEMYRALLQKRSPEIVFLVNAAGCGKLGAAAALSAEDQLEMLDLNIRALTLLCRLSLPYMAEKSRIVNFASAAAFLPQPDFAVYAASKSYVLSYTRALHRELAESAPGCKACAVCPGPVKTEFFDLAEKTGKAPFYKQLFMADPKKVVRLALEDSVIGKEVSVYGLPMQAFQLAAKLLPHSLLLTAMRQLKHAGGKPR